MVKADDDDRNKEMPAPFLEKAYLRCRISYLPLTASLRAAFSSRCCVPTLYHIRVGSNHAVRTRPDGNVMVLLLRDDFILVP